ncbi:MAG: hypothetical protein ABEH47_02765 [Haloferacaceae archaeon]
MATAGRVFGLIVGVFAVLGVALGASGYLALDWARTQFLVAAGGATPSQFGPVFVALVAFQTTVSGFLVGTAVAGLVGTMAGSRFPDVGTAALVAGGGSLVGFYLMAGVVVLVLTLVGGPGTGQVYGPGQAAGPLLLAGVPAAVAGGAGGAVGSSLVR